MNYEIPVVDKRENLRGPVISKLSGKLSVWRVAGSVWLVILTSRVCDIFAVNIEGV
jgi:hypothetical protein